MSENQTIASIHTSCKECGFAVFDQNTQMNCSLGRLDIYRKNNIELIEAHDEEEEFVIINDRFCRFKRPQKWFDEFKDGISEQLKKETALRYQVIIEDSDSISDLTGLDESLQSIQKQNNPAAATTVIKPKYLLSNFIPIFSKKIDNLNVHYPLGDYDIGGEIYFVIKHILSEFIVFLIPGQTLPNDFSQVLQAKIDNELLQFALLQHPNFYIIPNTVYNFIVNTLGLDMSVKQIIQERYPEDIKEW